MPETFTHKPEDRLFLSMDIESIDRLIYRFGVIKRTLDREHPRRVAMADYLARLYAVLIRRLDAGRDYLKRNPGSPAAAVLLEEMMERTESLAKLMGWDDDLRVGFAKHLFDGVDIEEAT